MSLEDRFWEKVEKGCDPPDHVRGEVDGDCWEWVAYRNEARGGYGYISVNNTPRGAHRISLFLDGVNIDGVSVLHKCDNPPCVNPDHLYTGDQQDNVDDALRRSPTPPGCAPGEEHATSVLTVDQVVDIRERFSAGEAMQQVLADEYGLDQSTVSDVVTGENWPDAPGPITTLKPSDENHPLSKLTDEDVVEIRERYASEDVSQYDLADEYEVASQGTIGAVVRGELWSDTLGPIKGEDY